MTSYYAEQYSEGTPWEDTGVGTNAGVTVAHPAAQGKQHWVTQIDFSGDAAALVTVESPAGTVLWRKRFAAAFASGEKFTTPIQGADSQLVQVKISGSTANCEANIGGFTGANV
jgi:hypothetical protein